MADDRPVKSAYELAMERLRKQDADAGLERRPVTDEQKAAIAEIRSVYQAKLAELELMHQSRMRATLDPRQRAELEEEYRRERQRLSNERDARVEKVRTGDDT